MKATAYMPRRIDELNNMAIHVGTKTDIVYTVKPVYSDHPRETKHVAFIDRWLLYIQVLIQIMYLHGNQFSGHYRQVGCYREVATKTGLTV